MAPSLAALSLVSGLAGCRPATPTVQPTLPRYQIQSIPTDTATPLPTATLLALPTAPPLVVAPPATEAVALTTPEPGCEIPLRVVRWSLEPAPDAPAEIHAAWRAGITHTLEADVTSFDESQRLYVLEPRSAPWQGSFWLRYSDSGPPLEVGQRYRFAAHQDVPGQPPAGWALRVDDQAGVLYFAASVRETVGADLRLLAGDRAGFRIAQQPTTCRYAFVDPCGYELRAAPVLIGRGDQAILLAPGTSAVLPGEPAYRATVFASHFRLWREDRRCDDPTDSVLAYELVRLSGP